MAENADSIDILLMMVFFAYEYYFIRRALKKRNQKPEKSIQRFQTVVFKYAVIEPWHTRYHWGGVVQLSLFFTAVIHANLF